MISSHSYCRATGQPLLTPADLTGAAKPNQIAEIRPLFQKESKPLSLMFDAEKPIDQSLDGRLSQNDLQLVT
jgi:hypothetical protein